MTVPAQLNSLYRLLKKYDLVNARDTLRYHIRKRAKTLQALFDFDTDNFGGANN